MSAPVDNPIVQAIRSGKAPEHVRAAAARGALPIPRGTLVQIFVQLLHDETEAIRGDAQKSLDQLGTEEIQEALRDEECPADVLVYFSKQAARNAALAMCIAFHPSAPVPALTVLAALGSNPVIELVLTNEELLLRKPGLLEKMMLNPALGQSQRGRLLELLSRASKLAEEAAANDEATAPEEEEDLAELAELLDVDVGELLSASEILGGEELEKSEDPSIRDAYQLILTLNAGQKAIMAMKGGREERLILVRDTNKCVAMGVLKNPRITDTEIESIAKMRNVSDEVLRALGTKREWVKSYPVIHALVNNPRTPQAVSVNFVSRLNSRDLNLLFRSREVPELLRRMARKVRDQRSQKAKGPKAK